MKDKSDIIVHIDGGSRGNPGPAALGVVIQGVGRVREYSEFLGEATNNEAEYQALIFALRKVRSLKGKERIKEKSIEIRSDSELLVKQVEGKFKIEEPRIQKLFLMFWNIKIDFPSLIFRLIPRRDNAHADQLVNSKLDEQSSRLPGL